MKKRLLPVFILFVGFHCLSNDDVIQAYRLDKPIEFDGWVNDDEWGSIPVIDLIMQIPDMNGDPSEVSEVRMAYDDEYLYLSGRLFDREADKIMANTKKRDALSGTTEFFGLVIDSYDDNENGLAFFTTPTALRWDMAISNDGIGRNPDNIDWNTFWDTKVQKNEEGWFAEMRIPFTSLAFEENDGEVIMGIITWRYIARKNEVDMYPLIPAVYGDWSSFRPSLAQDYSFYGIKPSKPFYFTPYVLGGLTQLTSLNESSTDYFQDNSSVFELGGDLKYGLSKSWTLDLSVNTDFAQVEADDQQVNLTRFSLFFPEKRLFFQERAGIFDYSYGGGDQLFYSRRIGIVDGQQTRIYGGARVVGRSGKWDIGMLSMQTASQEEFDGENMTVIRARREIINSNSDAGFMLTNRTNLDGTYNMTYGLDASIRHGRDQFISIKWSQTASSDNDYNFFSLDPTRFFIAFFSRNQLGFSYAGSFTRSGKEFNPGLGFQRRDNFIRMGNRLQYNWFPGEHSSIFTHGFFVRGSSHWDNATGDVQSLNYRVGYEFQTKSAWALQLSYRPNRENLVETFDISDEAIVPIGDYTFSNLELELTTPFTFPYNGTMTLTTGNFYDGKRTSLTIDPNFNVSSSLEISGGYEYNRVNFEERNQSFSVHLVRLKGLVMFSTKTSIAALLQYTSDRKNFLGNIRFRYNPTEGNDLYIVFNDDLNTDRFRESPFLPRSNARSILIKYSYTFKL